MFRGVLIHNGSSRAHMLRYLVAAAECLHIQRDFDGSPNEHELRRALTGLNVEVAVVDLQQPSALKVVAQLRVMEEDLAIIGFGPGLETALLAGKAGTDEVLAEDASPEDLRIAIQECLRKRRSGVMEGLYCFLPAKAGSGCSTTVMNLAVAAARDEGKRVLVIDADLRSGVQAELLGTEPKAALQNVLAGIHNLDAGRLEDFVHRAQGVDFLLSSRALDAGLPEWADYFHLLSLVQGQYDLILVDLPELINEATYELVRRSARVLVVSTAELPALALTRQRCEELTRLNIPKTRVGVVVTRWQRTDPTLDEIGGMVQQEIAKAIPNDYVGLRAALLAGQAVSRSSRLGQAYSEFAAELSGRKVVAEAGLTGKLRSLWGLRETIKAS
jgi:MinD-like ATPase involved in chromosome partitioning or flagellar assembly